MEYENGLVALRWFNYSGLAAASKMEWNKEKECPVPQSKSELNAIATMTFDWLDCPDHTQADTVEWPQINTEDLSIPSFDTGHLPSKQTAADDNSLATA